MRVTLRTIIPDALFFFFISLTFLISGCSDNKETNVESKNQVKNNIKPAQSQSAKYLSGMLTETFNAGRYTYAKISAADGDIWVAGPTANMSKGDKIGFATKMLMKNFHSESTQRDFKEIYFTSTFIVNGNMSTAKASTKPMMGLPKINPHAKDINKSSKRYGKNIVKAKSGQTIAEVLANVKGFRDKVVKIRGQVSKYTPNILGTNWVHIQDSSTEKDITVTTSSKIAMGDVVLVEGKLLENKDFGKGFIYELIVNDASISIE